MTEKYRGDHVGSLLRPDRLRSIAFTATARLRQRERLAGGEVAYAKSLTDARPERVPLGKISLQPPHGAAVVPSERPAIGWPHRTA